MLMTDHNISLIEPAGSYAPLTLRKTPRSSFQRDLRPDLVAAAAVLGYLLAIVLAVASALNAG